MSDRGYVCIGLDEPKCGANIDGVMRAAHVFGARMIAVSGDRVRGHKTDTTKAWKHIPVLSVDNLITAVPTGASLIAVDLVEGATPLPQFKHPERAFYVFGGEDRTLCGALLNASQFRVMVPTRYCMNLAATVNVVLYDRLCKRPKDDRTVIPPLS